MIKTRFAPSPTGNLHIGVARTAIFNWLFARKNKGEFYLRIEDTDKERSKKEYVESIKEGLNWLGLEWDDDIFFQSHNIKRHVEIAQMLLNKGMAYYCYATQEEIQEFKKNNPNKKFISKWRKVSKHEIPQNNPVVRLKVDNLGTTKLKDTVLGEIEVKNSEIDDMVLLRSDGTPTYLLSCIVDDYDMGITDVIRGNDHLTNTFRQIQILKALSWKEPNYTHIPLIHGSYGNKLSKRDGALDIKEYQHDGYLPEALFNYLLRLGWSHGDSEIISIQEAIKIFDLTNINKSPAKFDIGKLRHLNQHYIQIQKNDILFESIIAKLGNNILNEEYKERIKLAIPLIKARGETINDIADLASLFISPANPPDDKSQEIFVLEEYRNVLTAIYEILNECEKWNAENLKIKCSDFAKESGLKPTTIMKSLRAAVLGTFKSPPIYETMEIISKKEVLNRISKFLS